MLRGIVAGVSLVISTQAYATDGASIHLVTSMSEYVEETGDVLRIESADLLRTYSQEVAAAACFYYNDIDATLSRELLEEARAGFDKHHDALLNGNEAIGIIGGEKRKKTIAELQQIGAFWSDMRDAVDSLLADQKDSAAVNVIKAKNLELFEMTDTLAAHLEGQYANPNELLQSDAILIEIVGRQAMMTQKIAKNACKIFTGNDSAEIKDHLSGSMSIYEASLDALMNGMPQLGIQAAPTPEISKGLSQVMSDWKETRPVLEKIVSGESVDRDAQVYLFRHMAEEMIRLEEIAYQYVEFSKHSY